MSEKKKVKILLTTGIFPPDIGGPATYAAALRDELPKRGFEVKVVTYGDSQTAEEDNVYIISRKQNILFRYWKFFRQTWKLAGWADVVYAFDIMSSGLPAVLAARLRGRKPVIRIGGDYLWENAVLGGRTDQPLKNYYQAAKIGREEIMIRLNAAVMRGATRLVFTTAWLKDLYVEYYGINPEKTEIIDNPFPSVNPPPFDKEFPATKKILYAGRLLKLKNLKRAMDAVSRIRGATMDIIGDGPERGALLARVKERGLEDTVRIRPGLAHGDLMEEISRCRLFIIPSLSEVSPNLALECVKLGKPVIVTRECGLYEQFKDNLVFIDPLDVNDIREKIEYLLDEHNYHAYVEKIKAIDTGYSWPRVIDAHTKLFISIIHE